MPNIDSLIESNELLFGLLMMVCQEIHTDPKYPADIYGANFENDVFKIHRYCWCEDEECPYCGEDEPYFIHKASGLKIWWYKYIGRSFNVMYPKESISNIELLDIFMDCVKSINNLD